jgi:hypothetical protein
MHIWKSIFCEQRWFLLTHDGPWPLVLTQPVLFDSIRTNLIIQFSLTDILISWCAQSASDHFEDSIQSWFKGKLEGLTGTSNRSLTFGLPPSMASSSSALFFAFVAIFVEVPFLCEALLQGVPLFSTCYCLTHSLWSLVPKMFRLSTTASGLLLCS